MKKLLLGLFVLVFCTSVSFGDIVFDYTISDTYEFGTFMLNSESLLITCAGADGIFAQGESYVEVQGTDPLQQHVGGIYTLDLIDFSTMNYFGGETGMFSVYENAIATFSGGRIDYIASFQDSADVKHITFVVDLESVDLTGDFLTGDWLGGGAFSITLQDQVGYDSVYSNINFVPEPATVISFGLGGMFLRNRKR